VKLTNKRPELNRTFDSVKKMIEGRLIREKRKEALDKFIADLKARSKIEIFEDNLAKASFGQHVQVSVQCVVYHSGYRGEIMSPGVSKPTEGTIESLKCNGKKVGLANNRITDGFIETEAFGKIGIRFASMVLTRGAGDSTSVAKGTTAEEKAIEVYVKESMQKSFLEFCASPGLQPKKGAPATGAKKAE
jgi:hypothetical protein